MKLIVSEEMIREGRKGHRPPKIITFRIEGM